MTDERKDQLTAEADGLIEGRNAVIEALRDGGQHRQNFHPEG